MARTAQIAVSNITARLTADLQAMRLVDKALSYAVQGRWFMPSVRNKRWDGVVHLLRRDGTFPAGLAARAARELRRAGYQITWSDQRKHTEQDPRLMGATYKGEARDYQDEAVAAGIAKVRGIFAEATGTGKTDVMVRLLGELAVPTIILVHKQELVRQTIERLEERLEFASADMFGTIGEGHFRPKPITVAMLQTLHRRLTGAKSAEREVRNLLRLARGLPSADKQDCLAKANALQADLPRLRAIAKETADALAPFGAVFFDECHHLPAKTYFAVMNRLPNAYYRFGFSATPMKSDKATELNLVGATGEIIHRFDVGRAIAEGVLVEPYIYVVNLDLPPVDEAVLEKGYQEEVKAGIVFNEARNKTIIRIARRYTDEDIPTIILVRYVRHGDVLSNQLGFPFLSGRDPIELRDIAKHNMIAGRLQGIIASTIFDEGIDIPNVGCIINAGGGRAPHIAHQKIGRGLRRAEGKDALVVYDFNDTHAPHLESQSLSRIRTYGRTPGFVLNIIDREGLDGLIRSLLRKAVSEIA